MARLTREGAAAFIRWLIDLFCHTDLGIPPRDSVVSGKTETSTGVTAWKPHSCTRRHVSNASSRSTCLAKGGAFSAGTFTVHAKSSPARSAMASRITLRTRARFSTDPPNSSVRRL